MLPAQSGERQASSLLVDGVVFRGTLPLSQRLGLRVRSTTRLGRIAAVNPANSSDILRFFVTTVFW